MCWILEVNVVCVLFWGIFLFVFFIIDGKVFFNKFVFNIFNLLCIVLILLFFFILIVCCEIILFVFNFLIIYIIVMLVFCLLLIIVWWIGVLFLYFGNNDVCILIVLSFGNVNNDLGNNCLKVVVIIKFIFNWSNCFNFFDLFNFLGWYIGKLYFIVIFLIGGGVIICLCLIGWFGCVMIVMILCFVISIFKIVVEKFGVFINIILVIYKICFYFFIC